MNNPATEVTAPRCPKCGSMESSVEETRKDGEQMSTETPESLPCGCKIDVTKHGSEQSVYWNPYNKVVQCHQCGTVYDARVPVAAGDADQYRAGMLHAARICKNEFWHSPEVSKNHDGSYMSGYEDACDHLSIAIEQASVIDCVAVAAGAGEARRAAEEISSTFDLKLQEASLNQVAAIVTKHLGARG
jgi:hypothetical protein